MRTLKELFIELKLQYATNYSYCKCICYLIYDLRYDKIITNEEADMLYDFMKISRPKWYSKHYNRKQQDSAYWWKPYDWTPRLKWIDAQIKKLK